MVVAKPSDAAELLELIGFHQRYTGCVILFAHHFHTVTPD